MKTLTTGTDIDGLAQVIFSHCSILCFERNLNEFAKILCQQLIITRTMLHKISFIGKCALRCHFFSQNVAQQNCSY